MEYKTVLKNGPIDGEVNKLIKEGYKPIGGISIVSIKDKLYMSQAMVRTAKKTGKKHFKPPTLDEVKDYIKEKKYTVDPDKWILFYMSKNWMIGKAKMVDWKSAIGTWQHNYKDDKKPLNIPSKPFKAEVVPANRQLSAEQVQEMKKKMNK